MRPTDSSLPTPVRCLRSLFVIDSQTRICFSRLKQARLLLALAVSLIAHLAPAQQPAEPAPPGDAPANAGPLATDLSPALTRRDMGKAMRRVADWQLGRDRKSVV